MQSYSATIGANKRLRASCAVKQWRLEGRRGFLKFMYGVKEFSLETVHEKLIRIENSHV